MTCQGCADTIKKGFCKSPKGSCFKSFLENNKLTIESNETFTIEQIDQIFWGKGGNYGF
ncbi:MAG: hypothetical protein CM1200mP7_3120 [Chloroflexota bacterium]|nr:MAG: hypothetical protein CM1200mP7_3120 [Chloroflexota bacterium]